MNEVIIKYLDILKIKFIGSEELIELVKKYYAGLETQERNADYIIQLSDKILPKNIEIPTEAKFNKCFAGSHYYYWQDNDYNLAYSLSDRHGAEHFVIRKANNLQVFFNEEKTLKSIIGISRELLVKEIIKRGYMPIHAAAIKKNEKGYVFLEIKIMVKVLLFFLV